MTTSVRWFEFLFHRFMLTTAYADHRHAQLSLSTENTQKISICEEVNTVKYTEVHFQLLNPLR